MLDDSSDPSIVYHHRRLDNLLVDLIALSLTSERPPQRHLLSVASLWPVALFVIAMALLVAGSVTSFIALHDHPIQQYRDIVVGSITLADADKSSDFKYLFIFLALLVLFGIAGAEATRYIRRKAEKRTREGLVVAVVACMVVAVFAALPHPWLWGSLAAAGAVLLASLRRDPLDKDYLRASGFSLTLLILAYFAGQGLLAAIGRWASADTELRLSKLPELSLGLGIVFVLTSLVRSRDGSHLLSLLAAGILCTELLVPLCYLIFLPARLPTSDGAFVLPYTFWLPLALGILIAAAWWQVGELSLAWKRSASSFSLDSILSPLSAAAVATYLAMFTQQLPFLSDDHFQVGEQLLPWQQLLHFHSIPYITFAPIHGLNSYLYGLFASVFFDGTAASFPESQRCLFGIAILLSVCVARPICGVLLAVLCAMPLPFAGDRNLFIAAAIFVLVNPRLLSQRRKWLLACIAVCAVSIWYNAPAGAALVACAALPAAYVAVAVIREHRPIPRRYYFAAAAALIVCVAMFPVIRGWLWFVTDNAGTNLVAHGIAFRDSLGDVHGHGLMALLHSTTARWAFFLEAWILVSAWGFYLLYRQLGNPASERRFAGGLAAWFIALFPVAFSSYSFVRIDPGIVSRPGLITVLLVATILPVLSHRLLPPFKSLPFALIGLAIISVAYPGQLTGLVTGLTHRSATLLSPTNPSQFLVDGRDVGLPEIGRLNAHLSTIDEIRRLKHALSLLLGPDDTYFDLTNRQAYYYYLDLPIPQLYVPYVAVSEKMQERMLRQWKADPSPVVLVSPATVLDSGPASLRCYRIYREMVLNYSPLKLDEFTFLVNPKRLPSSVELRPDTQRGILDAVFLESDLRGLPSAWGRSWASLQPRFRHVVALTAEKSMNNQPISPVASFNLQPLSLRGSEADFATVDFDLTANPGQGDPQIAVSWSSADQPAPPRVRCWVRTSTILLPLGAQPRWLLSDKLQTFRLELLNPATVNRFRIARVTLWKLNDLDQTAFATGHPAGFRFKRPRAWAKWSNANSMNELSDRVRNSRNDVTSLLPSNKLSTIAEPALITTPDGQTGVFAHAPAQFFLPVHKQQEILNFGFGILPGAYADGNRTHGVLFKVWLQAADGRKTLLWSRMLNPLDQARDRGAQHDQVRFLAPGGARLVLETDPAGDVRWDWSYWEDVSLGDEAPATP